MKCDWAVIMGSKLTKTLKEILNYVGVKDCKMVKDCKNDNIVTKGIA